MPLDSYLYPEVHLKYSSSSWKRSCENYREYEPSHCSIFKAPPTEAIAFHPKTTVAAGFAQGLIVRLNFHRMQSAQSTNSLSPLHPNYGERQLDANIYLIPSQINEADNLGVVTFNKKDTSKSAACFDGGKQLRRLCDIDNTCSSQWHVSLIEQI